MKKFLWGLFILIILLALVIALVPAQKNQQKKQEAQQVESERVALHEGVANAAYIIDGESFVLENGNAYEPITSDGAVVMTTSLFGQPVAGDLNGDGVADAGVLLQRDSGGTGVFYYLAAAINVGNTYRGTNALFLGDRIAPQTIEIRDGVLIANYADRAADEPFSARPSFGKSLYSQMKNNQLVDVSKEITQVQQ